MGTGTGDRWEQGAEMGTGKRMEQVKVGSVWEVGKETDEMEDRGWTWRGTGTRDRWEQETEMGIRNGAG